LSQVHALFTPFDLPIENWIPTGEQKPLVTTNDPLRNHLETNLISQIRSQIAQELPAYMVPSAFMILEQLPLTPNGKLNRRALPEIGHRSREKSYRPPQSEKQAVLCKLYEELTGVEQVGIEDSFFNIGGHSLLAMRLITRLRQDLGVQLPMRVLFEHPSVLALSTYLEDNTPSGYTPLFKLRAEGTQTPLFCVHPAGGNGAVYKNLADELGPDQPVWAFQARGLEEGETPHASIVEMASAYLAAMKSIQPQGPYRLLGWSFGGTIAQEMAHQLELNGETVEMLVLLDSAVKGASENDVSLTDEQRTLQILEEASHHFNITDEVIDLSNERFIRRLLDRMALHKLVPAATPIEAFKRTIDQMLNATKRVNEHKIQSCASPILFIRAALDPTPADKTVFDWSPYTSEQLISEAVQTVHSAMWESEPSKRIAQLIRAFLSSEVSGSDERNNLMDLST
jgi:thioesterase domain-containing protein/acyl carrier protein